MKPFEQLTARGKLRRMRKVAQKALECYDLNIQRLRFLVVETNTMFRADADQGGRFVLRIYSDEETTLHDNLAEMFWLNALKRDTALAVSEPISNRDGNFITIASADGVPGKRRCALFRWVPGRPLEEHLSPDNYYQLGCIMAQLHDHAETLNPPHDLQPKRWDTTFYYPDEPVVYNTPPYAQFFPPERVQLIDAVIQRAESLLKALYADEGKCIWIHGDLHYWNVHFHRGNLIVIDFEDIMQGYPLQDIAITLYYGQGRDDHADLRQAFQSGYTSLRSWPVGSEEQLKTLWAARSVNFVNYVARIDPEPADYIERRCRELGRFIREMK